MRRGVLVFMVPTIESHASVQRASISMRDYVAELDGLVLQGGADVSPESYRQQPIHPDWAGDRVRDRYEIELLWEFVFQGKPVLGICRGAQLINVAFGGTLIQDIASQVPDAIAHHDQDAYDEHAHEISIEPSSSLARLYPGIGRARVSSIHHQAIGDLGNGLAAEARSVPDGLVEAVRWTGSSFVLGLQWHPEFHGRRARSAGPAPANADDADELLDSAPVLREFLFHASERCKGGASASTAVAPAHQPGKGAETAG